MHARSQVSGLGLGFVGCFRGLESLEVEVEVCYGCFFWLYWFVWGFGVSCLSWDPLRMCWRACLVMVVCIATADKINQRKKELNEWPVWTQYGG